MKNILNKYFMNLSKSNRLSHAFLICNTNYEVLKDELSSVLLNYFFDGVKDIENCTDIYIIRPVEGKISKENILKLQEIFMTQSQINKNRVYIIDQVECMNEYASNSLLKFLEEPEDNIYAFLISSNVDMVLPTIRSRAQIIRVEESKTFNIEKIDDNVLNKTIKFVELFEENKIKTIAYLPTVLDKKEEKDNVIALINTMKYFYRDCLNYKIMNQVNYFNKYIELIKLVCKQNTEDVLLNKLIVLNKRENMLQYNLNLNMYFDNLIIEMGMMSNG